MLYLALGKFMLYQEMLLNIKGFYFISLFSSQYFRQQIAYAIRSSDDAPFPPSIILRTKD